MFKQRMQRISISFLLAIAVVLLGFVEKSDGLLIEQKLLNHHRIYNEGPDASYGSD